MMQSVRDNGGWYQESWGEWHQIMADAYLDCAGWTDDEDIEDGAGWGEQAYAAASAACRRFLTMGCTEDEVMCLLLAGGWSPSQAGHDLWLTRNGHGTGFWDRMPYGYTRIGEMLSHYARQMGEQYVSVGDDGWIYLEGGD